MVSNSESPRSGENIMSRFGRQLRILLFFVGVFWALEAADTFLLNQALNNYGIKPLSTQGLRGIVLSPFLHGGFGHLAANTIPFLVLGWLVMIRRTRDLFIVMVVTVLVSGFGVWLLGGPNTVHIGASGLVFGFLGFLLLRGFFERSVQGIVIAILVGILYGGLVWGVLPTRPGVSWQSHLFGFIGGILAARLVARRRNA